MKNEWTDYELESAAFEPKAEKKILSVSELNREVKNLLERKYNSVWVEAEISNLKKHTSGHIYLTLKDESAQICAVYFSRYNRGLKFQIKDGLKVLVLGKISLYEARGQYQFYIEAMEPKGLGALQLAFAQLKEKLYREGLFDPARKKPIPLFPETVGIVTSPTGAAIKDILNVVNRRFKAARVLIYPVKVQGEGAAQEIAHAVREMNKLAKADVLIVGRGGGSLEDLWAFNEEIVARAVYESKIPIISAVGHEIDWTICDWAADLRAPTPSAAAELVVQNREDVERRFQDLEMEILKAVRTIIRQAAIKLKGLESSYALRQPLSLVQQHYQRTDDLTRQLSSCGRALLSEKSHSFRRLVGQLEALSPLAILERGYSLTKDGSGKLLKEARAVKEGDVLTTLLMKGSIKSKVTEIMLSEDDQNGRDDPV